MSITQNYKQFYFITPKEYSISDIHACRQLNDINRIKKIDLVYLKYKELFPVVEDYCFRNSIPINRVRDSSELLEKINELNENNQISAYISRTENEKILRDSVERLSNKGYFIQVFDE